MHIMFNHIRSILIYLLLLSALPAMSNTDHGDHLGSANWITDDKGYPVQYIHYAPYGELIANQRPCDYDERFKFTGKERDYESGYDAFGARYYSCVFGHWLSVDPLADKYPNISPYAYCGWNPVRFVDPNGEDIYTFDEDGSFLNKKVQDGIHYGVMQKNGEQDFSFAFADPINDPRAIDEGKINRAICVSDNQISQILTESGVFDSQNKKSKYSFIFNESNASNIKGDGRMDYFATGLYNGANISNYNNSLFITDIEGEKTAHNTYNFGNFLWGAGAAVLGVPYGAAFVGSHLNNFFNDPSSKWHFDSKDDQLSIKLGFQWQQRR